MKRFLAIVAAFAFVAAACQAPRAGGESSPSAGGTRSFAGRSLNIVTGGSGGVYIVYGAGLANVLTNKLGVAASAQSTAASVDNMKLIRDGKADLAFTLSDIAWAAVNGKTPFNPPEKAVDAKALAVLYTNYMHLVVKDGAGINTISDLKSKRVSVGAAGSGTEVKGLRVLETVGLAKTDDKGALQPVDIQPQRLGVADSANALQDGKIDAFFWDGGLPTAAVLDLANSGTKIKLLDQTDAVKKMADKYGAYYFPAKIPAGTYKNEQDVTVAGVANLLVAPSNFDPALAKAVLQTMFDNKSDLVTVHVEAKNLSLENAVNGSPIDYLPAAIDFYKEKGVWKK